MAWTFCTKDQVVATRHFNPDQLEDDWSNTVEAMIKRYLRSPYLGTTQAITGELYSGDNTPVLVVKKPPIYSVEALTVSDLALQSSEYAVFPGHIMMLGGRYFKEGVLNISLNYTSGGDVDPIVNMTAVAMIVAFVNFKERYGSDVSLTWGLSSEDKVDGSTANLNVGLTSHLTQIMKRMLERNKLRIA